MGGTRADQSLHPLNLLAFYDFPAEHWIHLRTTNPLESVFATVRQRTNRTKGSLSPQTAKLILENLVPTQRNKSVAEDRRRCQICRRHRGHHGPAKPRRLIGPITQIRA